MSVFVVSSFGKGYYLQFVGWNHEMNLGILAVVHNTENLWPLRVFGPRACPISKGDNVVQYFGKKNPKLQRQSFYNLHSKNSSHPIYSGLFNFVLMRMILFLSPTYLTHEFASRTIGLLEFPILDPRITSSFLMLTLVVKEA